MSITFTNDSNKNKINFAIKLAGVFRKDSPSKRIKKWVKRNEDAGMLTAGGTLLGSGAGYVLGKLYQRHKRKKDKKLNRKETKLTKHAPLLAALVGGGTGTGAGAATVVAARRLGKLIGEGVGGILSAPLAFPI